MPLLRYASRILLLIAGMTASAPVAFAQRTAHFVVAVRISLMITSEPQGSQIPTMPGPTLYAGLLTSWRWSMNASG